MKIALKGTILSNDDAATVRFFGITENVCPADIEKRLRAAPNEPVELAVNSSGGDVFAASEIRSLLGDHPGGVTAIVQSIAASAATIAITKCKSIKAEPTALFCIHDPSTVTSGNSGELRYTADQLDTVKDILINSYMPRAKISRQELWDIMTEDKLLTPQEAFDVGLCDEVIDGEKLGEIRLVASLSGTIFPTAEMIQAYREHNATRTAEKAKLSAKLELLKIK